IFRPRELRVRRISQPEIQHAIDHQNAACLFALRPLAELLDARRVDVRALKVGRAARDFREAETELLLHEWLETIAIAVGAVQVAVVGPSKGPIVAALRPADDARGGRPLDARDD